MFNSLVPNQRDKSKVFIGGYFEPSLAGGVTLWLKRRENKRQSASDFLHAAIAEKLDREGIEIEIEQKTSFGSNLPQETFLEIHDRTNSTLDTAAKVLGEQGAASVKKGDALYARKRKAR